MLKNLSKEERAARRARAYENRMEVARVAEAARLAEMIRIRDRQLAEIEAAAAELRKLSPKA